MRKIEEIKGLILERQNLLNIGQDASKISSHVRKSLNELNLGILNLENALGQSGDQITEKEFSRREGLISTIKMRKDELQSQFSRVVRPQDNARQSLLSSSSSPYAPANESHATRNMDSGALVQQQEFIMQEQDSGLEALQQSIARQKQIGMTIGNEIDDQNVMLEELSMGIDNTGARVKRETQHIVYISEKAKVGGMCCCIVLLIILIILIAAIPF